jgi:hypothetical protein
MISVIKLTLIVLKPQMRRCVYWYKSGNDISFSQSQRDHKLSDITV